MAKNTSVANNIQAGLRPPKHRAFLDWRKYLIGIGLVALGTLIGYLSQPFFTTTDIVMVYLLCVVIAAIFLGLGSAILVGIMSVLAHDFFFVEPRLSFGPPIRNDIPTLVVLLGVSIAISYLASRVRVQTENARRHENQIRALYRLSRGLAGSDELDVCATAIIGNTRDTLGLEVLIFLPVARNSSLLKQFPESTPLPPVEKGIAAWSFQYNKKAGRGTENFQDSRAFLFLPLATAKGVVGTMVLKGVPENFLPEQQELATAFADLAAVALERLALAVETREMKVTQQTTQKLQTSLLDSISHDLRTPLSSVIGVLDSLQEGEVDETARNKLVEVAREQAAKLNDSITNLLDTSRIQAGAMSLLRQPCDVNDIISLALDELGERTSKRSVVVNVNAGQPGPLFLLADFALLVKVIMNLVDNALKYSPPESPVEITALQAGGDVEIEVADRGVGIPPGHLIDVFERFNRVSPINTTGTGLGLSICKGIIQAHGGSIQANNRPGGGTILSIRLPTSQSILEGMK